MSDRSPAVFIVSIIFTILATIFTIARCISKWVIRGRSDPDDYITVLAWALNTGFMCSIMIGTHYGLGKVDAEIKPEWDVPLKKLLYSFTILYNPVLMATKTAILVLYIRLAAAHRFLRYASMATMAVVNIAGIVLTFLSIFQCSPIKAAYSSEEGSCINLVSLYLSSAPINILTDFAILLFPLPVLTSLRIEMRAKIALIITFIFGGFVTAVDVIRVAYLQNTLKTELLHTGGSSASVSATSQPPNFIYDASFSFMWSGIETSIGLMCCCVLVLKPLLQRFVPSFLGGSSRSARGTVVSDSYGASEMKSQGGGGIGTGTGLGFGMGLGLGLGFSSWSGNGPVVGANGGGGNAGSGNGGGNQVNRSPQMPLQAILETSDDVPDEDQMDIYQFFSGPPPGQDGNGVLSPAIGAGPIQTHNTLSNTGNDLQFPRLSKSATRISNKSRLTRLSSSATSRRMTMDSFFPGSSSHRKSTSQQSQHLGSDFNAAGRPVTPSPLDTGTTMTTSPSPITAIQAPTQTFFDFVQMGGRKPLTQLSNKEALWPVLFVTCLFVLWGFSYGLLGTLNAEMEAIIPSASSPSRSLSLTNAYWLGYFVSPLTIGPFVLLKYGFKSTFITGLSIYAVGCMAFWPSSVLLSYPGCFLSNFIVAAGLSLLEVASNPYIALSGPNEHAEARLCFSQAAQGVGSIVSPILASQVLFTSVQTNGRVALFAVQWCYLAVAVFVILLALVFFYVPLSEADHAELESVALYRAESANLQPPQRPTTKILLGKGRILHIALRPLAFFITVLAMFLYVGGQETIDNYWNPYILTLAPNNSPYWTHSDGRIAFAVSRMLASAIFYFKIATPRVVFLVCSLGAFASTVAIPLIPQSTGSRAIAPLILSLFFQAPLFPTLFAMALRGQGRRTKLLSIALVSSIVGGAAWPSAAFISAAVKDNNVDAAVVDQARRGGWVAAGTFAGMAVIGCWMLFHGRWFDPKWSRGFNTPNPGHANASGSRRGSNRDDNGNAGDEECAAEGPNDISNGGLTMSQTKNAPVFNYDWMSTTTNSGGHSASEPNGDFMRGDSKGSCRMVESINYGPKQQVHLISPQSQQIPSTELQLPLPTASPFSVKASSQLGLARTPSLIISPFSFSPTPLPPSPATSAASSPRSSTSTH